MVRVGLAGFAGVFTRAHHRDDVLFALGRFAMAALTSMTIAPSLGSRV
jgi:hypothetical protein